MVSKSGHDMCARDLSTPSEPEVLLGRMRNSGDKDEVFEIPEETDWSDWSELELEDSQIDIECRCSIRLELESCWRLKIIINKSISHYLEPNYDQIMAKGAFTYDVRFLGR